MDTTPAPVENTQPLGEDEVLDFTQRMRKGLVDDMTGNGTRYPSDPKDRTHFLMALDGLDRQALSKKKIASDEKVADADRLAASVINSVFAKFSKGDPFISQQPIEGEFTRVPPRPDLNLLPAIEIVPGETDIGTSELTFDSFMATRGVVKKSQEDSEE